MWINTPRYRGEYPYGNACDNSMIRVTFADETPIVLADHINAPDLPATLGPGLLLDGNALCETRRFEINAYCVAALDGQTRRWRIDVSAHASLAERIASDVPAYELLYEKLYDGPTNVSEVRSSLDYAIRYCRFSAPKHGDDITPALHLDDEYPVVDELRIF